MENQLQQKHTPGPWTVYQNDDNWPLVMAGGPAGKVVANVNPESCPDHASAPAYVVMPAEANARLIAAAPELLEALKAARPHIGVGYSGVQRYTITSLVDAAIAKAEKEG